MKGILLMLQATEVVGSVQDTAAVAAGEAVEAIGEEISLWELTKNGGWWIMGPLAIMAILTVYIFIERFMAIQKATKDESMFMNNISDMIHEG